MSFEKLSQRQAPSQKELNVKKTRRWLWLVLVATLIGGGVLAKEFFNEKEAQTIEFKPVPKCRDCGDSLKQKQLKPDKKEENLIEEEPQNEEENQRRNKDYYGECRYA